MAERDVRQWLRERRKAQDLTQEALAQVVGCAPATIRRIEAGARRPSRQVAERLAQALAITPDEHPLFIAQLRGIVPAAISDAPALNRRDALALATRTIHPTLPLQPRPFIGRVREAICTQVAVFQGGCTRLALQAVTGASLAQIQALIMKALLRYEQEGGRYTVHELLRQYAAERLADEPLAEALALLEQVQAMDWVARAHTSAAHVAHALGRPARAWAHIGVALRLSLRHRSYMGLMFALRPAALLTADSGVIAQAVELGELARQLTYGRWAEDICYTQLDALAAQLPAEVAAAARERGLQRDPWLAGQEVLSRLEAVKDKERLS